MTAPTLPRPPASTDPRTGRVALVGGGPGDPGLLTVRGRDLLHAAHVVLADRLGTAAILDELPGHIEVVDVGKARGAHRMTQQEISELIVDRARQGQDVVRLKGGDPFVLGRGGEESLHCAAHGIAVEVVPGITSAISVPAAAGIPVTHRGLTASFVVASGHDGPAAVLDGLRLAPPRATLVLLMGVDALGATTTALIAAGRPADTPVAIIESGWTPQQRVTRTDLAAAAADAAAVGVGAPAVIVIGEVVRVADRVGELIAR